MGPPGAGKGTQAILIKNKYKIPHISTGEMFRDAMSNGSPLGMEAHKYIDRGQLVPDDITIGLVKDRIARNDCETGFLFDGFPRTIVQAEYLDKLLRQCNHTLDAVLNIDVCDEVLINRIAGRRICSKCGAGYHIESIKPKVFGICDICGGELIQREDDDRKTVIKRLHVYDEQTKPLLEYYKKQGLIKNVNGETTIADNFIEIQKILGGMNDNIEK
jgi:adenylate kinase